MAGLQKPAGVGLQPESSGVMGTSFYISPEIEQVQYGMPISTARAAAAAGVHALLDAAHVRVASSLRGYGLLMWHAVS